MPTTVTVAAEEALTEEASKAEARTAPALPCAVRITLPLLKEQVLPQGLTFLHAPSSLSYEALYSAAARAALQGTVLWRDAVMMFDPRRVAKCAARMRVNPRPILVNVRVARSFTVHQFVAQMEALRESVEEWGPTLVIVTGFYTHFEDPDADRWDVMRLLRRAIGALGTIGSDGGAAAFAHRGSLGRDEEDSDEGSFVLADERPSRRPPHPRPSEARPGVVAVADASCPIILQDRSRPRALHRLVAPNLALDTSYEELRREVQARVVAESLVCRPRLPGQAALEEFAMTVEGARGCKATEDGRPIPRSPVISPSSIKEMV